MTRLQRVNRLSRTRVLRSLTLGACLCTGAVVIGTPNTARAGDSCKTAADMSAKVWNETPGFVKSAIESTGPFGATAIKALEMIDQGVKIWNKLTNDKSWKKIGPRRLDFEEWNTGTLFGPTERMFLSGIPAVNPVQVDFHKLDHDGEVKVVVCTRAKTGPAKAVKSFTVAAGAPNGKVKSVRINGAKGKVVSVVLHGKSATNKLKYKVRARMIYPESDEATTVTAPREDNTVTAPREDNTVTAPREGDTHTAPR